MNQSSENVTPFDVAARPRSNPADHEPAAEAPVRSDSPPPRKIAILVLGMHRSGTSSIAGVVAKLGAQAPNNLLPSAPDNERGYFESKSFMDLNDEILASAGTRWDDWRAFNPRWLSSPVARSFEEKATATIEKEFGAASLIVIKDPRMCRMMPFWSNVMDKAGYDIRVVVPLRLPLEVARSLWLRDGFPISKSLLLWLRHALDAETASRSAPTAFVEWSSFLCDWRLAVQRIGERLGIEWPRLSDISTADIDNFLSPSLRHNSVPLDEFRSHPDVNEWVSGAYEALQTLTNDPTSNEARAALDEIATKFQIAERIFGRVLFDFEESQARERQSANVARGELESALNEWRLRDERIAALAHEIAIRDQQIAALAQDRDTWAAEAGAQHHRADQLQAERDAALRGQGQLDHDVSVRDRHIAAVTQERDNAMAEAAALRQQIEQLTTEREA
jgi:hypothetical protein